MRQSKLTDEQLQQLADGLRAIASKFDPAIVEELIDRRVAMDQPLGPAQSGGEQA